MENDIQKRCVQIRAEIARNIKVRELERIPLNEMTVLEAVEYKKLTQIKNIES